MILDKSNFSYCVAIRTLGKAGEKYQQELESLWQQTIKPDKILIYIAEGYDIPKETIGIEQYIYVKKGMVAQRALPYHEIDTEYVLFLDDDVFLPPDSVERLYKGLIQHDADCIAADTFSIQRMDWKAKFVACMAKWVYPRSDDKWAFKILKNGSFSYNNYPKKDIYLSQSAAGPASLWKMSAYKSIHFEDELWFDQFPVTGEDVLFFNKLYANKFKLLVHYRTGIIHLDAGSSQQDNNKKNHQKLYLRIETNFVIWWRIVYNRKDKGVLDKLITLIMFFIKFIHGIIVFSIYSICQMNLCPIMSYIKGNYEGYKYVHSSFYKSLPDYIVRI